MCVLSCWKFLPCGNFCIFSAWNQLSSLGTYINDVRRFSTIFDPPSPLIRFCPISAHAPIIWRPILTLRHPPPHLIFLMIWRRSPKIYHFLSLFCPKHNFTMQWDEIFSEVAIFFKWWGKEGNYFLFLFFFFIRKFFFFGFLVISFFY